MASKAIRQIGMAALPGMRKECCFRLQVLRRCGEAGGQQKRGGSPSWNEEGILFSFAGAGRCGEVNHEEKKSGDLSWDKEGVLFSFSRYCTLW